MGMVSELVSRFAADDSGFNTTAARVQTRLEAINALAESAVTTVTSLGAALGTTAEAFGTAAVGAGALVAEIRGLNRTLGSQALANYNAKMQASAASTDLMTGEVLNLTRRVETLNAELVRMKSLTAARHGGSAMPPSGGGGGQPRVIPMRGPSAADSLGDLKNFASQSQAAGRAMTMYLTVPIMAAELAAVHFGSQFEASMAKVQGLAGVPAAMVASWEPQIRKMAEEIGRAPHELAEGMFYIASEGYRGAQALQALTVAAKMAEIGMGKTATNAKAIVFTMHDFGVSAREAGDVLVATEREGNVEVGSLATNLYKVLLPASQLHVKLRDLGASIAALTRSGMTAPQATTALSQFFSFLQKPSKQAQDELKKLHLNIQQLRDSAGKDLIGTFLKLYDVTKKDDGLTKLLGNIRAFRAELGELAGKRSEILKFWENFRKSHDDLASAYEVRSKTLEHQFHQTVAALENAGIAMGAALRPTALAITHLMRDIADAFEQLDPGVQKAIAVVGAFVAVGGPLLLLAGSAARAILAVNAAYRLMIGPAAAATVAQSASAGAAGAATVATTAETVAISRLTLSEFAAEVATANLATAVRAESTAAVYGGLANMRFAGALGGLSNFAYGAVSAVGALISKIGQLVIAASKAISVLGVLMMAEKTSARSDMNTVMGDELRSASEKGGNAAALGKYQSIIEQKKRAIQEMYNLRSGPMKDIKASDPQVGESAHNYMQRRLSAFKKELFKDDFVAGLDADYELQHQLHQALGKKTDAGVGGGGGGVKGKGVRAPKESEAAKQQSQAIEALTQKIHEYAKAQIQAGDDSEYAALKAEILTGEYKGASTELMKKALAAAASNDRLKQTLEIQKALRDSNLEVSKTLFWDDKNQFALEHFGKLYSKLNDEHKKNIDLLVKNKKAVDDYKAAVENSVDGITFAYDKAFQAIKQFQDQQKLATGNSKFGFGNLGMIAAAIAEINKQMKGNYESSLKSTYEETMRLIQQTRTLTDAERLRMLMWEDWYKKNPVKPAMSADDAKAILNRQKENEQLQSSIDRWKAKLELVKSYAAVLSDAVGKMADEALTKGLRNIGGLLRTGLRSVSESAHGMVIQAMKDSVQHAATGVLGKLFHVGTGTPLEKNTKAIEELTKAMTGKGGGCFGIPGIPSGLPDFLNLFPNSHAALGGSSATGAGFANAASLIFGAMAHRESGGPVTAGRSYLVGERRPEVFIPSSSGTIASGANVGGDNHCHQHFHITGQIDRRSEAQIKRAAYEGQAEAFHRLK